MNAPVCTSRCVSPPIKRSCAPAWTSAPKHCTSNVREAIGWRGKTSPPAPLPRGEGRTGAGTQAGAGDTLLFLACIRGPPMRAGSLACLLWLPSPAHGGGVGGGGYILIESDLLP